MGAYAGGCAPVGGAIGASAIAILVLYILLVIILQAGFFY